MSDFDPRERVAWWRRTVIWWLTSDYMHVKRPDLAELLPPGETVTLTYEQLHEIVETARQNAKQR